MFQISEPRPQADRFCALRFPKTLINLRGDVRQTMPDIPVQLELCIAVELAGNSQEYALYCWAYAPTGSPGSYSFCTRFSSK